VRERIRDQVPPSDFCNCKPTYEHPTGTLVSSQGRGPQPSSFSYVPRSHSCECGRHAASRATSARDGLGVGSSRLRRFARPRYLPDRATSPDLRRRSVVTIDVHGPLDRAKDVSPIRDRPAAGRGGCMRLAHADNVPLLGVQRASAVTGATARKG
jgi:hypothetical protein